MIQKEILSSVGRVRLIEKVTCQQWFERGKELRHRGNLGKSIPGRGGVGQIP